MDTFSFLIDGFALAIQPANLIYAAIGVLIGRRCSSRYRPGTDGGTSASRDL